MIRIISVIILLLVSASTMSSQITVDNPITPEEAVQQLLGSDLEVSNIVFSGFDEQLGFFECIDCGFDFESGVILGTGDVSVAVGPNDEAGVSMGGDPLTSLTDIDLGQISEFSNDYYEDNNIFYDIASLEFDFVARGEEITFSYTYASDEYPDFIQNTGPHDVFGLIISGPGINGTFSNNGENIALIPGTNIGVTNVSLNAGDQGQAAVGDSDCNYCEYYVFNGSGYSYNGEDPQFTDETVVQYDGYTTGLVASKEGLICGETYHLRMVIGDVADGDFDSAVVIEANSIISSAPLDVSIGIDIGGYTDGLLEGCGSGELLFQRPENIDINDQFNIEVVYSGEATHGIDYTELPTTLEFAPGVDELLYEVVAFEDADDAEGAESVIISFISNDMCTRGLEYEFTIDPYPEIEIELDNSLIVCTEETLLEPVVSGGIGTLEYEWSDDTQNIISNDLNLNVNLQPGDIQNYTIEVTDFCEETNYSSIELARPAPLVLSLPQGLTGDCLTNFEISVEANIETPVSYVWSGSPDIVPLNDNTINYQSTQSAMILVEGDAGCGNIATVQTFVNINQIPIELVTITDTTICFGRNLVLSAQATGGSGELSYVWSGNSQEYSGSQVSVGPVSSTFYEVVVTDECPFSVGNTVQVEVERINASFITSDLGDDTFRFQANIDPDCSDCTYLWEFTDGDISEEEFPIHEFAESGYIGATLTVTTPGTCEAKYTSLIDIPPVVYIPNAFTPDLDGINEIWKVEIRGIDKYEISIYNRWGLLVFHSTDPTEAWNGNSNGGDYYVPDGIYSYLIEYRGLNSDSIIKTGSISVLR